MIPLRAYIVNVDYVIKYSCVVMQYCTSDEKLKLK